MKWLVPFILFLTLISCTRLARNEYSWLYQLQNIDPEEISQTDFDYVVIDYSSNGAEDGEFSPEDIDLIRSSGKVVLAYLSIGEAENYRFYWRDEWYHDPPEWLGKENPKWPGNYAVKYWMEGWKTIVKEYVKRILKQGFDGVYLDRVDEFEYWSNDENGEDLVLDRGVAAELMIEFIKDISDWLGKDKFLFIQNGESIVEYAGNDFFEVVDGIGLEDLFCREFEETSKEEFDHRMQFIWEFLRRSKTVLSVEYIVNETDPSSLTRVEEYYQKAENLNMAPYAAVYDRELDEIVTIGEIQPREVKP